MPQARFFAVGCHIARMGWFRALRRGGAVRFPSSLDRAAADGAVLWPLLDASRDTLSGGFLTAWRWWCVRVALPVLFLLFLYPQPKNLASFAGVSGVGPRAPRGGPPLAGGPGVSARSRPISTRRAARRVVGRGNASARRCNALPRRLCWLTVWRCCAVLLAALAVPLFRCHALAQFPPRCVVRVDCNRKGAAFRQWCKPKARRPKAEVAAVLPSRSVPGLLGAGGGRLRPACRSWPRRCCRSGLQVTLWRRCAGLSAIRRSLWSWRSLSILRPVRPRAAGAADRPGRRPEGTESPRRSAGVQRCPAGCRCGPAGDAVRLWWACSSGGGVGASLASWRGLWARSGGL